MAAGVGVGVRDWFRTFRADVFVVGFRLPEWETAVETFHGMLITDCKSVFHSLSQQWTSSSKRDKRTAVDLAIIRDSLSRDLGRDSGDSGPCWCAGDCAEGCAAP